MKQMHRRDVIAGCLGLAFVARGSLHARAEAGVGPVTNLPLPRFVSLRSSEINVRRGPGLNYPIDWVFRRAGLPVRIVEEFGDWRRILDSDDAGGWVYHALLTGRRTVLVMAPEVTLRDAPDASSDPTVKLQRGVVARLKECRDGWCRLEVQDHEGWTPSDLVWGIDEAPQPEG